ncbi:MAG TPA: SCO family protein [Brumimicrobium sp.]|nr:SCO family protein [Brumimicrobium sp.]
MKKIKFYLFFSLAISIVSCSTKNETLTAADLPIIGQHDIVYEAMDGYEVGDTIFHTVNPWEFTTDDSLLFQSSSIDDKLWIANFFFSYCPTVCVPMNKEMKKVNEELAEYADKVAFLSFSIDQKRDTPSRLKTYRKKLDFTAKNWYFFTGNQDEIIDVAIHDFQILANEDDSAPGGFIHSSSLVLVDKDKHIRGIYDTQFPEHMKQIVLDVKLLLDENK